MWKVYVTVAAGLLALSVGQEASASLADKVQTDLDKLTKWSEEVHLIAYFYENYVKEARPIRDLHQPVQIEMAFGLTKIVSVNAREHSFTVTGFLHVKWVDEHLIWNESDFGGLDKIIMPPDKVWLPSFILINTGSDKIYEDDWYKWFRVLVHSNGDVMWEPGGEFTAKCDIDVFFYPFDDQVCGLVFSNWVYTMDKVNLSVAESARDIFLEMFAPADEWEMLDYAILRTERTYICCPEPRPEVHFRFRIRRRPLFYIVNIIFPVLMLSTVSLFVFRLPPESGEKIAMGLSLLISYSFFILIVSEDVPKTADQVPLIVAYLVFFMGTTCVTCVLSVIILILHHVPGELPPPEWLTYLSHRILAPMIRYRLSETIQAYAAEDHAFRKFQDRQKYDRPRRRAVYNPGSAQADPDAPARAQRRGTTLGSAFGEDPFDLIKDVTLYSETLNVPGTRETPLGEMMRQRGGSFAVGGMNEQDGGGKGSEVELLGRMEGYLKEWRSERLTSKYKRQILEQWNEIAYIWDLLFFWLFLVVMVIVNVVVFFVVPIFKHPPDVGVLTGHENHE